jgi:hypothetical protein
MNPDSPGISQFHCCLGDAGAGFASMQRPS